MFKNVGIIVKKNPSADDLSVVDALLSTLKEHAENIYTEESSSISSLDIEE